MWDTCLEEWEDRAVGVLSFATMYTKAGRAQDCGDGTFQCQLSSDFTYDVAGVWEVLGQEAENQWGREKRGRGGRGEWLLGQRDH